MNRFYSKINTKITPSHINKIESPHEFMGKNLHYVNSAKSSSKSEFTLFLSVITVHILTTAFQVRKLLEIFPGATKNCLPKVHADNLVYSWSQGLF